MIDVQLRDQPVVLTYDPGAYQYPPSGQRGGWYLGGRWAPRLVGFLSLLRAK